jgi:hypothetical protein
MIPIKHKKTADLREAILRGGGLRWAILGGADLRGQPGRGQEVPNGENIVIDLAAAFKKHKDEFLRFDRIEAPRHERPDLCAFLMLHDLSPRPPKPGYATMRRMVRVGKINEIWLDADMETLATNATEQDIVTLIRCGVRFSARRNALWMSEPWADRLASNSAGGR